MRVDHREGLSPCACKQLNKVSASLAVEGAVDILWTTKRVSHPVHASN